MREIKLRAWDEDNQRFLEGYELKVNINKEGVVFFSDSTHPFNKHGKVTLTEYTGLKDENGQDIYEGDVVKLDNYDDEPGKVVKLLNGKFDAVDEAGFPAYYSDTRDPEGWIVIGSIYENPELLKGDSDGHTIDR